MRKFRKRPLVIEAEQFTGDLHTLPTGVCVSLRTGHNAEAHIHTREGQMIVSPGDWVIRGVQGEMYPCKPDIFEQTYEPVEEE